MFIFIVLSWSYLYTIHPIHWLGDRLYGISLLFATKISLLTTPKIYYRCHRSFDIGSWRITLIHHYVLNGGCHNTLKLEFNWVKTNVCTSYCAKKKVKWAGWIVIVSISCYVHFIFTVYISALRCASPNHLVAQGCR